MKSPNFTNFLIVGFYLSFFLFQDVGIKFLGSSAAHLGACAAFLPLVLLLRGRISTAISLVLMTFIFAFTISMIQQSSFSLGGLLSLLNAPRLPVYMFLAILLSGLFLASELDPDRLPHELSHWSGFRIFRPLIAVIAGRERLMRRLTAIREACQLRGIELSSPFQHFCKFHIWIVPLTTATICEAAYAYKFREMLGSAHRFIPTQPLKPALTSIQKLFFGLVVLAWLFGIQQSS